jgi:amidase
MARTDRELRDLGITRHDASREAAKPSGYASHVYLPATVGPAGLAKSGLPVGYQAIAASGCDKTATAFSRFLEKEIVGFIPPPGFD